MALLSVALLLPGGPVTAPMRAVSSTPTATPTPTTTPTPTADPTPTASPTPVTSPTTVSPTPTQGGCRGCVNPLDAICWEGPPSCIIVVVQVPPGSGVVTAHYRTVPMTARPQIDYVDVSSGRLVFQPGQSSAEIVVQLIPDPDLTQERTFGVELFDVSGADLARPMATVTIKPADV